MSLNSAWNESATFWDVNSVSLWKHLHTHATTWFLLDTGYILKLLPLFLIILPFCSNKFFSSAMADCSFWDWFSLRGIWWKQSFAYISRPKLGRLRTDPAALLPADDNLSTPRVAWMKAGAGWQIKQTTSLLSCLIFWENKWFSALLTKKITGGKQLLTMCRWSIILWAAGLIITESVSGTDKFSSPLRKYLDGLAVFEILEASTDVLTWPPLIVFTSCWTRQVFHV